MTMLSECTLGWRSVDPLDKAAAEFDVAVCDVHVPSALWSTGHVNQGGVELDLALSMSAAPRVDVVLDSFLIVATKA